MHVKLKFSLALLLTVWLSATIVFAQEGDHPASEIQELNNHPELNLNDDKTLLFDDARPTKGLSTNRDVTNQTIQAKKQENQPKPSPSAADKTEDPLSFNFLYFIIKKFKISDILDD